jgi:hypothetical protein
MAGSEKNAIGDQDATASGSNTHWKAKWIRSRDHDENRPDCRIIVFQIDCVIPASLRPERAGARQQYEKRDYGFHPSLRSVTKYFANQCGLGSQGHVS